MQTSRTRRAPTHRAPRTVAAAVFLSVALGSSIVVAQEVALWSEYQGGPAKTGGHGAGPEPAYRQAWRTPVDPGGPDERFGLSAPAVADGVAIVVGPEDVIGVDLASGDQAFAVARDLGPSVPAAVSTMGDRTTVVYTEGWGDGPPPAPTDGADASPSPTPSSGDAADAVNSHLAAFDLADQEPSWPPVELDGVSRTGVTIDDGLAFAGVNAGIVTAVDLADGEVAWRADLDAPILTSLAAADGLVLVGLQGDRDTQPVIVGLDAASGEERWRHVPSATSAVVSAVSVADDTVFAMFTGPSETSVVGIALDEGTERWRRRVNAAFDVIAPPVVSVGTVLVTDLIGHTRAFDAASGVPLWDFAQNAAVFRSVPALVGTYLLVPTLEGELGAIDIETGELVWRRPPDGAPMRSLAVAGEVIVGVRGGNGSGIEAFEHDPQGMLVREASPTTLAFGRMVGAMAIAAIVVLAVVLLVGRLLGSRASSASGFDRQAAADEDAESIHDPWEDEDPGP